MTTIDKDKLKSALLSRMNDLAIRRGKTEYDRGHGDGAFTELERLLAEVKLGHYDKRAAVKRTMKG